MQLFLFDHFNIISRMVQWVMILQWFPAMHWFIIPVSECHWILELDEPIFFFGTAVSCQIQEWHQLQSIKQWNSKMSMSMSINAKFDLNWRNLINQIIMNRPTGSTWFIWHDMTWIHSCCQFWMDGVEIILYSSSWVPDNVNVCLQCRLNDTSTSETCHFELSKKHHWASNLTVSWLH